MDRISNLLFIPVLTVFYIPLSAALISLIFCSKTLLANRRESCVVYLKRLWLRLTMVIMGFYFRKPILVSYNPLILNTKKCIAISNHQTMYDWWFFLMVLHSFGRWDDMFVVLKESLSRIPMFGYAMKCCGFIFLSRKLEQDREVLHEKISQLKLRKKYLLLFFPEGTIFEKETHVSSTRYAFEKNVTVDGKLFVPRRVLVPRKTGFEIIMSQLKDDIEGVIDITIFSNPYERYPQDAHSYSKVILCRKKNFSIFFMMDFYPVKEVLSDDDWMYRVFSKKDKVLEELNTFFVDNENKEATAHDINYLRGSMNPGSTLHFKTINVWSNAYYLIIWAFYALIGLAVYIRR